MTQFPTQLECPAAELTPGEPLRCRLKIYNPSEAVNEFTVEGLHEAAGWISTEPSELGLLPETDGEMALTILVPADARVQAGQRTVRLLVRSALDEFEAKSEDLDVHVLPVTRWTLEVEPSTQRSKRSATYDVRLVNDGNHPLTVELTATPSSNNLNARLSQAVVEIPAFGTAAATLKVAAPRYTGRDDLHHHIDVQGRTEETTPRSRKATFAQQPRLSRWRFLLLLVAILAVLVLALVAGRNWWLGQVVLEPNSTGPQVSQWQAWLNASTGSGIAVDGRFGQRTRQATQVFQRRAGLPATGAVDRRTWNAMHRHLSAAPTRDEGTLTTSAGIDDRARAVGDMAVRHRTRTDPPTRKSRSRRCPSSNVTSGKAAPTSRRRRSPEGSRTRSTRQSGRRASTSMC